MAASLADRATWFIKDPTDPALAEDPAIVEYKEILAEYDSSANPDDGLYLYGMSVGQLFQHLLESMDNICRDSVLAAAKSFEWEAPPLLLEGISIKTGEGDGFPSSKSR